MVTDFLLPALVGLILGILAGLGVGGGSLLMLWLTTVTGLDHPQARTVNLLFFLPCALAATILRWRRKSLDLKAVIPAIIAGCVSAILGTWLSQQIHLALLKKLFGCLLLFTGARELCYRPRKAR